MLSFVFPEAPVEYYVFDGRSALYHGAVVLGFSNGTCTIRLLKDGSQTSCSVATLRPSPPTAAAGVPSVGRGEPVDVFEPSTSSWRAMVTMHSAALPLAPNTTLVLLQPGDLNTYEYTAPVLRRGQLYTPGTHGASPWHPRPVDYACRLISDKSVPGLPFKYVGVRHPLSHKVSWTAEAVAAAAAAAAGDGRPFNYKARMKGQRQGYLSLTASTYQAVAARAHDVWVGTNSNFSDAEWQVVKEHLRLTQDEDPKMLPAAPAGAAAAGQAEGLEGDNQVAPAVGTKRDRPQGAAQDTPEAKRGASQK